MFDTIKRWDRILRACLLNSTKVGSFASGITSTTDILGELAIADKNIMFLGFSSENAHSTFGLRGAKAEDGSHGVDLLWVYLNMTPLVKERRSAQDSVSHLA